MEKTKIKVNRYDIFDYVVVNTKQNEFDYPKGDSNVYTNYSGTGGIQLDSFIKKFVYKFSCKLHNFKKLIRAEKYVRKMWPVRIFFWLLFGPFFVII